MANEPQPQVEPWMTKTTDGRVARMECPRCWVRWTFVPPIWLGDPWTVEEALRCWAGHLRHVHEVTR